MKRLFALCLAILILTACALPAAAAPAAKQVFFDQAEIRDPGAVRMLVDLGLISGYTEDVSRFNYGFVHGSRRKVGSLIVGWNEESQTIVVVPTVPDLSGCGEPVYYRRADILKAYRNRYPRM